MLTRRGVAKRPLVDFANAEDARPRALAGLGVHEASRGGEPHERMRAPRVRATKQRVELFQMRGLVVEVQHPRLARGPGKEANELFNRKFE